MEIDYNVIPKIVLLALSFLIVYFFAYRKILYSVVDPLFIWVFTTAFSSVLVLDVLSDWNDIIHFFASQACLCIGMHFGRYVFTRKNLKELRVDYIINIEDFEILRSTTYLLLCIYILSNVFIGYSKGYALFSDVPTESKIANFQNGFGIFRKISWSAGTFVSTSLFFLFLTENRRKDLFFLFIVVFFSSLEGSKSAIFQIAVSAGIVIYHPYFLNKKRLINSFNRYLPILVVATFFVFFLVLAKENADKDEVIFAFVRRLLYSADSVLYYYLPVNVYYFKDFDFFDFVHRIFNPLLGFLRIQPYMEAPGNIMVENIKVAIDSDNVTVGPNTPFYIEGRIYFNYWISFLYSAALGYLFIFIRQSYFRIKRSSAFFFVFSASFVHFSSSLIIDVNLAITQCFDLIFFVLPFYVLTSLAISKKLKVNVPSRWLRFFLTP